MVHSDMLLLSSSLVSPANSSSDPLSFYSAETSPYFSCPERQRLTAFYRSFEFNLQQLRKSANICPVCVCWGAEEGVGGGGGTGAAEKQTDLRGMYVLK